MQDNTHKKVFRSFALPIPTFDYLKNFQRKYQEKHNVLINNNQALVIMLGQHQQFNEENEEHAKLIAR
ncbi:hypothetical protein Meth11DRAFT_1114 [Methylophilaceae bacterium 11]|nr:hypothetical protein Meth11DRAFT_1114 [Methylophilaceae bacterium 11]